MMTGVGVGVVVVVERVRGQLLRRHQLLQRLLLLRQQCLQQLRVTGNGAGTGSRCCRLGVVEVAVMRRLVPLQGRQLLLQGRKLASDGFPRPLRRRCPHPRLRCIPPQGLQI